MRKILLISNVTRKFTNFIVPPIEILQELGNEVHTCANYSVFDDDKSKYNITMHHIDFERNPLNFRNIKAYKQLLKLMKKEKFDIVHCNTPIGGLLGRLCAKKAKIPKVIYTAHGFHFYKGAPLINTILYKNVEKYLAKYTDVLVTMNEEDYEAAKNMKLRNNGKIYKIHGVGIETNKFVIEDFNKEQYRKQIGLNKTDIMLISMGDLIKRKNYKTAIEAVYKSNNPNIHYVICGEGEEKENLIKFAEKLNISNQIHFLGYRKDIKELINCADIFIFTTYQEGLPRSMMEAMSAGLPCIASNIRGNVDLIEEKEFLFEPEDVMGFANAISELSKDREQRKKAGQKNLHNVKKFDINNVKKEMKNIYEEVLNH